MQTFNGKLKQHVIYDRVIECRCINQSIDFFWIWHHFKRHTFDVTLVNEISSQQVVRFLIMIVRWNVTVVNLCQILKIDGRIEEIEIIVCFL